VKICAVAMPELDGFEIAELSARLPFPHVLLMPELGGLQSAWVSTRDLGGVLGLEIKKNLLLPRNRRIKRALDYAICVPVFLFTLPLLGLLALAVVIVSPGSPIYRQKREGVGGRKFDMLKLRTMHPDAEARLERHLAASPVSRQEWEKYFKLRDDPRVLPVIGNFIRRSSLDELPQLWNILRGDMSLVGPRPFPDYHLQNYDPGFLALRRSVATGLTGLWQVELRSDGDIGAQQELDTYYIRNWSLWLDFYILVKTFATVLTGKGAK
jgi:lipopolysaccharide/colanic/teichoic acid biosynthesis glycosyltransferase